MLKTFIHEYLHNHSSFSMGESDLKELAKKLTTELNIKNTTLSKTSIKLRDLFWKVKFDSVIPFLFKNDRAKKSDIHIFQNIFKTIIEQPDTDEFAFLHCDFDDFLYADFYLCYFDSFTHFSFDLIPYKNIANFYMHPSCFSQNKLNEEIIAEFLLEAFYVPTEESKLNLIKMYKENLENEKSFEAEDLDDFDGDFLFSPSLEISNENREPLFKKDTYSIKETFNSFPYDKLRDHFVNLSITYSNSVLKETNESFLKEHFSSVYFKIKQTLNKSTFDPSILLYPEFESDFFLMKNEELDSNFTCLLNGDGILPFLCGSFVDELGVFEPIDFCSLLILCVGCEDFTSHEKRLYYDHDYFILLKRKLNMNTFLLRIKNNISDDFIFSSLEFNEIEFLLLAISDFYTPPVKSIYEPNLIL